MASDPHRDLSLLVLAAGMGSRYGGLKQIEPVGLGGETLLEYSVYDALRAGFGRVLFLIRRDIESDFRSAVGSRIEGRANVDYAFQELDMLPPGFSVPPKRKKPWGTAHAVLCARGKISGPFAAINADDFYGPSSFQALADQLRSGGSDYAMVGFSLRNTLSDFGSVARGICKVESGYLKSVREVTSIEKDGIGARFSDDKGAHRLSGDETASMNFWGFTPAVFEQYEGLFREFLSEKGPENAELYITSAVNRLIERDQARVRVLPTSEQWLGVTYKEDRNSVVAGIRAMVRKGIYPERLWA